MRDDKPGGRDGAAIVLDLRGLNCPMPVLRMRKALRALSPGAALIIECTDPLAAIDIPHCVRQDGHTLESQTRREDALVFVVRRGAG